MGIPRPKTKAVEAPGELKRPPRGEASRNAEKKRLGPAKRENRPTHREKAKGSQPLCGHPAALGPRKRPYRLDSSGHPLQFLDLRVSLVVLRLASLTHEKEDLQC